jgi:hypothetical protein
MTNVMAGRLSCNKRGKITIGLFKNFINRHFFGSDRKPKKAPGSLMTTLFAPAHPSLLAGHRFLATGY